jgi:hypothetical protein
MGGNQKVLAVSINKDRTGRRILITINHRHTRPCILSPKMPATRSSHTPISGRIPYPSSRPTQLPVAAAHQNHNVSNLPRQASPLGTLPLKVRHIIYGFLLPPSCIFWRPGLSMLQGESPDREGAVSPYQLDWGLDLVSKQFHEEWHSHFWTQSHLILRSTCHSQQFFRDFPEIAARVRTLTITLDHDDGYWDSPFLYGVEKLTTMKTMCDVCVNLTELNITFKFQGWGGWQVKGDDFQDMPFFKHLQPFPKLQSFHLLDLEEDTHHTRFEGKLKSIESWVRGTLIMVDTGPPIVHPSGRSDIIQGIQRQRRMAHDLLVSRSPFSRR